MKNLENDKEYIKQTLVVISQDVNDLAKISVYNDDFIADEVREMVELIAKINKKVEEKIK